MRELGKRIEDTISKDYGGIYWCEGEYGRGSITIQRFSSL